MTKKMYKSEKKVVIFDLAYILCVSLVSLAVYVVGSPLAGDGARTLGVFVLIAYMLFMLAGTVIRSYLSGHKVKRGEKTEQPLSRNHGGKESTLLCF